MILSVSVFYVRVHFRFMCYFAGLSLTDNFQDMDMNTGKDTDSNIGNFPKKLSASI